ncbi:MAG: flavin reductase family protein [Rhodospirillaceae bacterium]|jgi:flavin reductase (DIM6/NTAB) family NADH-FMN oxidoreductase RutF|nr:flavin reductase family protein [Rhodospirillaceae bacterium]MBT4046263.1 flavin reductase family protein [Rhodospirillaceae bacterium]MBT4687048.1 flavin reductase family protein [Rhodospirillaceae bacterium]MBT5082564.1 flavin reductase family protein [Rhodospirillaceae bacterium]MBT5526106.1 flavin reductase family protein [Rhodospirillaceae bacterium]
MKIQETVQIDQRAFRDAMGCFASAVTVISTTTKDGQAVGTTVNSFNSVSLDPPLVLFCLGREATNFDHFMSSGRFAVNILRQDQDHISTGFASDGSNFFQTLESETSNLGNPLVPNTLATFDCEIDAIHDGGDHIILIGRVSELRHDPEGDPLLYYRGRYGAVTT